MNSKQALEQFEKEDKETGIRLERDLIESLIRYASFHHPRLPDLLVKLVGATCEIEKQLPHYFAKE